MSVRTKHFALLILTQTGCIAVGLWMQYHFTASSICHKAEEQAFSSMQDQVKVILPELDTLSLTDSVVQIEALKRIQATFAARFPETGNLLIVDRQWRIVDKAQTSKSSTDVLVSFTPLSDMSHSSSVVLRGKLAMPDGKHLALACPLKDNQGYALFYLTVTSVKVSPVKIVKSMAL
ncbi:MAG: hypothetical protein JSV03_15090, partial [Planctomycetota bacterium]